MIKCKATMKNGSIYRGELVGLVSDDMVSLTVFTVHRPEDIFEKEPDVNFLLGNCSKVIITVEEDPK
jgi:hypothetical protein